MISDKRHSRDDKLVKTAAIVARLAAGESVEDIKAGPAPEYEPKPHEIEAAQEFLGNPERLPKYWIVPHIEKLAFHHPRQEIALAVVMKAVGVTDQTMFEGLIGQITNALSKSQQPDIGELNTAIAMVAGMKPRDNLEAMLAFQMAAVHILSLRHTRAMVTSDTLEQLDLQERVVNKLMRTFTSQMEALRKHRNGGNQKVVVEHVHVHEGGQAIVGNVTHGGEGRKRRGAQFHEQGDLSISTGSAVLSHIEADQMPMPGAGRTREEGLPVSRGTSRSAKG
ncbi:Hypothetical protein NGAL_HAMBI2605_10390 [Neorhizobium galegae bv. orientalis]|nr:Hypothetical protein NGAL_HAMBI2605_10390 [Neorhizobium galegae bv. orientalis]